MPRIALALIAAAGLSLGLGQSALAADLPQRPITKAAPVMMPPPLTWTGCYIGGNVGAAWGRAQVTDDASGAGLSATNSGVAGGGQIGCDYQFAGGFVIGARDMFDWTNLKGSTTGTIPAAGLVTADSNTKYFNTLTARLGYAVVPNWLIYFQGGGAWTRANYTVTQAGVQVAQFANNKGGYVVGGGGEYMFAPNWSAFVEYNYMNFGTNSTTTTCGGGTCSFSSKKDSQNVLLGVNYRFH